MSRQEKLLARLLARPRDFEWDELVALLSGLGFEVINKKGVRFRFIHPGTGRKLMFHKPHPESTVLQYVLEQTIELLKELGIIK